MNSETETINIKRWLENEVSLEGSNFEDAKAVLLKVAKEHGFKIRSSFNSGSVFRIEAISGSKFIAFLTKLIPVIGVHLPSGKRFYLEAILSSDSSVNLYIRITPYMELIDAEEVGAVTQGMDEKATDEYIAARKVYSIFLRVHSLLKLQVPDKFASFSAKFFARDTLLGILLYPLDSYKAAKKIIVPPDSHPPWCWGGFIIPEFWFMWHEIWGVSMLAMIPTGLYAYFKSPFTINLSDTTNYILLFISLIFRIFLGFYGNRIYFLRYGGYPGERKKRQYVPPIRGPKWNWKAFVAPEFWLLWNELWGVGILALLFVFCFPFILLFTLSMMNKIGVILVATAFALERIIFGLWGNRLFFAKYGRWPSEPK